jgi:DNA recombination protein RmuC
MLVTARKLNDLDENALGTEDISAPKELEIAPVQLTASELAQTPEIEK